jgi:hypothetical protein
VTRTLAAIVALVCIAVFAPAAQATRTADVQIGSVPGEVAFTDRANDQADPTIFDQVERLLVNAQPGSTVMIALHSIGKNNRMVKALVQARRNGVNLKIVYDKKDGHLGPVTSKKVNGPAPTVINCAPGSCFSNAKKPIMHAKFMLFTSTKRHATDANYTPNVTWIGSANMTAQTGTNAFNNATVWYGDQDLFNSLSRVWNDLAGKLQTGDYFQPPGRGVFGSVAARTEGYVSPEHKGDLLMRILRKVKPTRHGCQIRVMQAFITNQRLNVARRLRALKRGGCKLQVLVNENRKTHKIGLGSKIKPVLRGAHKLRYVHDKIVLIQGTYEGRRNRTIVLAGSHNMSGPANNRNAEVLVGVYDVPALYLAYVGHFIDGYGS